MKRFLGGFLAGVASTVAAIALYKKIKPDFLKDYEEDDDFDDFEDIDDLDDFERPDDVD